MCMYTTGCVCEELPVWNVTYSYHTWQVPFLCMLYLWNISASVQTIFQLWWCDDMISDLNDMQ